jgi:spermidine synthase
MVNSPTIPVHKEDNDGLSIEIRDCGELRSLYFADDQLQSRMCLSRPWELALPYTRFMTGALLLVPKPHRIALIGLGAGSLAHFFLHHFPQCHLHCIDKSRRVIELAKGYFRLPEEGRMVVQCCDGLDFVKNATQPYDLLLIDAFDEEGMAASIYHETFFNRCAEVLTDQGALACNLWSGNRPHLKRLQQSLAACFATVWYLPVPDRGNIVAWASHQEACWERLRVKKKQLSASSQRYGVNFHDIAAIVKSNNLSLAQRLLLAVS